MLGTCTYLFFRVSVQLFQKSRLDAIRKCQAPLSFSLCITDVSGTNSSHKRWGTLEACFCKVALFRASTCCFCAKCGSFFPAAACESIGGATNTFDPLRLACNDNERQHGTIKININIHTLSIATFALDNFLPRLISPASKIEGGAMFVCSICCCAADIPCSRSFPWELSLRDICNAAPN